MDHILLNLQAVNEDPPAGILLLTLEHFRVERQHRRPIAREVATVRPVENPHVAHRVLSAGRLRRAFAGIYVQIILVVTAATAGGEVGVWTFVDCARWTGGVVFFIRVVVV